MNQEPDTGFWVPPPSYDITQTMQEFWRQFWGILNWFNPFILRLLLLSIALYVITRLIQKAFPSNG